MCLKQQTCEDDIIPIAENHQLRRKGFDMERPIIKKSHDFLSTCCPRGSTEIDLSKTEQINEIPKKYVST